MTEDAVTFHEDAITFHEADQLLFTIKADGTIERGEGFTTIDEMSLKFWKMVEKFRRPVAKFDLNDGKLND